MEKENSKKVTVISIFLALVCIAILGFIIYFKVNNKDENKEKKPETNEQENSEQKEENVEEQENVEEPEKKDDELAENLYAVIGYNPELREQETVTYETLSESVRDSIVLNNLNNVCQENVSYAKDIFLAKYKAIFNHEKESEDGLCAINENNYECNTYCGEFDIKIYGLFKKYEIVDNSIVLYEEAAHLDYSDDGKVYLKENAIDSTAIASFETYEDLTNSEVQYKLPTYKHTFNKAEDGTYYWVSSESVKQ